MKKFLLSCLTIIIVLSIMFIKDSIPTYNKSPYDFETAIKNGSEYYLRNEPKDILIY